MITEDLLKLHDDLEKLCTARPWSSVMTLLPGYNHMHLWSIKSGYEIPFRNVADARYLAFARNVCPEFVKEIKKLHSVTAMMSRMIVKLREEIAELEVKLESERKKNSPAK